MAQELSRIVENYFLLGYNDRDKPETLRMGKGKIWMADIVNAFVDENKIIKRNGYSTIGNAPQTKVILGQNRHEPYGSSKYILRARNNAGDTNSVIEGWPGTGNWTELTSATSQTADSPHEFVTINNATYIFNEAGDPVLKTTNGTSASVVAAIPEGIDGRWFHNFFFVFGVSSNPARLYFSDVTDPETFAVDSYIDVDPGDNEPIIALAVLNDELLIIKPSRVWSLFGFGVSDFTLDDIGERGTNIGTVARRSVVETGNDVYYLSYRGDVPHFRSLRQTKEGFIIDGGIVSDDITGTMKRINTSQISKVAGEFDGRRVWWAIPTGTSVENNEVVVLDTLTGGWTRHTGIAASVLHLSTLPGYPAIYFGSAGETGKSYRFDNSKSDDGEDIEMIIKSPFYGPQPGYKAKYKYMYVTTDANAGAELEVKYSLDGFTFVDLETLNLTGTGAAFGSAIFGISRFGETTISKHRINNAGGDAYWMQYQFYNNASDEDIVIRGWEIFYKLRGLRDIRNLPPA